MTDLTPQQQGRAWEPEFAASIGGEPVMMSGAGFTKLDVDALSIVWSLKWAGNAQSIRFEDAWMREALAAIRAPGGRGGLLIPGVAFKTAGGEYLVLRKADGLMLMSSDQPVSTARSQGVVDMTKRRPELLRED